MSNMFSFRSFADSFDSHIEKSIRGYSDLTSDIKELSRYLIDDETNVVDIGSSTGRMLFHIYEYNKDKKRNVKYQGIEIESAFSKYYEPYKDNPDIEFFNKDIRDVKLENCSFIYSLFTLQFLSYSQRRDVLYKIFNSLNQNGKFLFSEKVNMKSELGSMLQSMGLEYKRKSFSDKDILDKELDLRYLMRKKTIEENINDLKMIGFREVTQFWQNGLFVAFYAVK